MESVRDNRRTAVPSCHTAGKSFVSALIVGWWLESHPVGQAFVVTSAPTDPQVKAILWREINKAHARGKLIGRTNQKEWYIESIDSANASADANNDTGEELVAFGRKPNDLDFTAFQGIHARYVLVIFDEACGMARPMWDGADTLISNADSRFLAIGNPDDPHSEFCSICKPGSGWNVIPIPASTTPNLSGERVPDNIRHHLISQVWIDEKIKKYGEGSAYVTSKVHAQFPESTEDTLIPASWIRAAQERTLSPDTAHDITHTIGVDVGGGGAGQSVICYRQGGVFRILSSSATPNTMVTLGRVIRAVRDTGASIARVDNIGIGKGAVDRYNEQIRDGDLLKSDVNIVGVNVGEPASDPSQFANLKAENYWGLREMFQDGDIDIDALDEDLAAQLTDLRFDTDSKGRIIMESKDAMARRGVASPDRAEALMLAAIRTKAEIRKFTQAVWGKRARARVEGIERREGIGGEGIGGEGIGAEIGGGDRADRVTRKRKVRKVSLRARA